MEFAFTGLAVLVVFLFVLLLKAIRVVQEYERGVIFRLGRVVAGAKGPGLFLIIPFIDRMVKVNLQTVTMNVPVQDVITRDNVTVRVLGVNDRLTLDVEIVDESATDQAAVGN